MREKDLKTLPPELLLFKLLLDQGYEAKYETVQQVAPIFAAEIRRRAAAAAGSVRSERKAAAARANGAKRKAKNAEAKAAAEAAEAKANGYLTIDDLINWDALV